MPSPKDLSWAMRSSAHLISRKFNESTRIQLPPEAGLVQPVAEKLFAPTLQLAQRKRGR